MGRWLSRSAGLALLTASGGTTLLHRAIFEAARHGAAQVAEFAIVLLTFTLASAGILLLIHGAKLFETSSPPARQRRGDFDRRRDRRLAGPVLRDDEALDTRDGVGLIQARRVIAAAAAGRRRTGAADVGRPVFRTDRH